MPDHVLVMPGRGASELRRQLVAELRAKGVIRSAHVADAFLAVPRERFIPGVVAEHGLEAVYRDAAFVTKKDLHGKPLSSSSQPALMAEMLELLDVRPGQRVLEIGAGSGYNAALLAHIVGSSGRVMTVDVDPELAETAGQRLRDSGYRVEVIVGDGRRSVPRATLVDRMIVTARADEIPRAWLEQLAIGGRLALPLQLDPDSAAIQVIPVLERHDDRLRSVGLTWGGFMPLHGGDGGWGHPPASLTASRSCGGKQSSLMSVTGGGLAQLSDSSARALLAATLADPGRPLAEGLTDLDSAHPPLLLVYLLMNIPARRRVSIHGTGRLGIGIVDARRRGLAVVSIRSPWVGATGSRRVRTRWRLDAFGDGTAAARKLQPLLAEWRDLQRTGRTALRVSTHGREDTLRITYAWT